MQGVGDKGEKRMEKCKEGRRKAIGKSSQRGADIEGQPGIGSQGGEIMEGQPRRDSQGGAAGDGQPERGSQRGATRVGDSSGWDIKE